jgi:hypothetical protein
LLERGGHPLLRALKVGTERFGERDVVMRVGSLEVGQLAALDDLLVCELSNRFKHLEPELACRIRRRLEQAVFNQRACRREAFRAQSADADGLRRREAAAAAEYGQPAEQNPLAVAEKLMALLDRVAERSLTVGKIDCAPRREVQRPSQVLEDRLQRHVMHVRRGQLDRERKPVEPSGDLAHHAAVVL